MKRLTTIIVLILLAGMSALLLFGCTTTGTTKYDKEILARGENGAFNFETLSDLQSTWSLATEGSTSTTFSVVDNGSQPNYLKISTNSSGYATVSQRVYLRSYSYYKVSYKYTSSAMTDFKEDVVGYGLVVGFEENPSFNFKEQNITEERASNTNGSAVYYFKTGNIREVTMQIHVGTPDNPISTTNVTLKDISLTKVTKAEATAEGTGVAFYQLKSSIYNRPSVLNNGYVIAGAIVTIILGYAFYMLRARNKAIETAVSKPNEFYTRFKESKMAPVLTVVGGVLFVRLLITLIQAIISGSSGISMTFFGFDLEKFAVNGIWLANYGPTYFFEYNPDVMIMPLTSYLITLAGLVGRLVGQGNEELVILTTITMIKLFAIAADVGTALILYKIIKSKHGSVAGCIMALFYSLMPVLFINSAYLGSITSITVFFVVFAFYFVLKKNYIGMVLSYFAACMLTPSALLAVPFVLMYTVYIIIQSIKEKNLQWIKPAVAVPSGLIAYFVFTLPFFITSIQKGKVFAAFDYFIALVQGEKLYTLNAFNFQGLLGNNFGAVSTASTFVTILFISFVVGILGIAYFKSKNRLSLIMLTASFILIYWYFCNNMLPETVLLVLPLLFIYTAIIGDKRLFAMFTLLSSFAFINSAYVFMVNGYETTGISKLDYSNPIMYIMGSFYLVLVIAYVVIGYDTVVNKRSKEHLALRVSYPEYAKSVFKNFVINMKNFGYKTQAVFETIGESFKERFSKSDKKKDDE